MADAGTSGEQDKDKQQTLTPGATGASGDAGQGSAAGAKDKDTDFQKVIDAVIKRERTDAAAKAAELQRQIDELKAQGEKGDKNKPKPDDEAYAESIRKPILAELEAAQAKITARDDRTLKSEIKTVAGELSVDADEVAAQLRPHVRLSDADAVEVIGADGRIRYGKSGPMTVAELVTELLVKKPYLAKATVRNGLGLQDAPKHAGTPADAIAAVQAEIAALEKEHKFAQVGPLKTKLLELQSQAKR